jgi:hypothetical protein
VRDAIAQHLGGHGPGVPVAAPTPPPAVTGRGHASHVMFVLPSGDSACLIEPSVTCTHCGYCKSYGH